MRKQVDRGQKYTAERPLMSAVQREQAARAHRSNSLPAREAEGTRTPDPQNHNLML